MVNTAILSEENGQSICLLVNSSDGRPMVSVQNGANDANASAVEHLLTEQVAAFIAVSRACSQTRGNSRLLLALVSLHDDGRTSAKAQAKKYSPCNGQNAIFRRGRHAVDYANFLQPRSKTMTEACHTFLIIWERAAFLLFDTD